MSETLVVEIKMGGHWRGPGVVLSNLISDFLAIQNLRNALPEVWWDNPALGAPGTSIALSVMQQEDGCLTIRKCGEPEGHILAST